MFPPILIRNFNGLMPKRDRRLLPEGYASVAVNCDFRSGALRPRKQPLNVGTADDGATGFAISAERDFFSVDTPCYQARWRRRIIVSGSGAPYYIEEDGTEKPLGIPTGGFSLSGAVSISGDSNDRLTVAYAISIRNKHGDQSYLFPSSPVIPSGTLNTDGTVTLTVRRNDEFVAKFDENDAVIEIWATNRSDGGGGGFFYIGEIPLPAAGNDVIFRDSEDTRRQERYDLFSGEDEIDGVGAVQPPADMKKIIAMPGDFLVGHDGKRVWFSEAGRAATWPKLYTWPHISAPARNIIGIETNVDNLYIFMKDEPPIVVTMTVPGIRENQLPFYTTIPWPCIGANSIVNTGHGIFYATRSGLVALVGEQGTLITKEIWERETFAEMLPEQMRCFTWDGLLMGSSPSGAFILDSQAHDNWSLSFISERPTDAKEYNGDLYFIENGVIYLLDGSRFHHTATWRSGVLRQYEPVKLNVAQVRADYSPISAACHLGGIGTVGFGPAPMHEFAAGIAQTTGSVIEVMTPPTVKVEVLSDNSFAKAASFSPIRNRGRPQSIESRQHDEFIVSISTNADINSVAFADTKDDLKKVMS